MCVALVMEPASGVRCCHNVSAAATPRYLCGCCHTKTYLCIHAPQCRACAPTPTQHPPHRTPVVHHPALYWVPHPAQAPALLPAQAQARRQHLPPAPALVLQATALRVLRALRPPHLPLTPPLRVLQLGVGVGVGVVGVVGRGERRRRVQRQGFSGTGPSGCLSAAGCLHPGVL